MSAPAMCSVIKSSSSLASPTPRVQPAAAAASQRCHRRHRHFCSPRQALAAVCAATDGHSGAATAAAADDLAAPLAVLREACQTKAVPPPEVLAAISQIEAAHKQQQPLVQGFPASLTGTWRLAFSSPSPIAQWQYIPVREDAVVDAERGTIDLTSVVGPLDNAFKGTCTFEQDAATGRYDMLFSFSATKGRLFGLWDFRKEFAGPPKLKVYSFFLLSGDLALANSSGGPKTLMYRVPSS